MFCSLYRGTRYSWLVLALAAAGSLCGCTKNSDKSNESKEIPTPVATVPVTDSNPASPAVDLTAALHKPFNEATTPFGPTVSKRPNGKTAAGKNFGEIYEQIAGVKGKAGLWETIRFVSPAGKPIRYQAVIKTDLGDIHLDLFPDKAPNHVRNFIALAKVGYYDGLAFDFINAQPLAFVVAGCPLGTFETGTNLGYWLLPEISDIPHGEGVVGALRDAIPDGIPLESAGCKFYINVSEAKWMDGTYTIFGKVTQGLDVVRKLSQAPTLEGGRPQQPMIIRSVVIDQKEQ